MKLPCLPGTAQRAEMSRAGSPGPAEGSFQGPWLTWEQVRRMPGRSRASYANQGSLGPWSEPGTRPPGFYSSSGTHSFMISGKTQPTVSLGFLICEMRGWA